MARSKEFDVDDVLGKAMDIFWRQGYENTSMQDLVAGMGIHKRSMYDTFGDKHTLYLKAMDRYAKSFAARTYGPLEAVPSVKEAVRRLFEAVAYRAEHEPKGCLLVNSAVELSLSDPEVADRVNDAFSGTEKVLEQLIAKGQASGEITAGLPAAALAACLHNALVGLRVMVKTAPDKEKLQAVIDTTLAILD
ncbi:TetR/AcrR family transcriptional regulator ['Paenibacillus yunnanensis' Narsing Rao et al. 2020]|uniref:TetR/AcrR family transcriptional regulator n=1 Tax=Paenibacillus tengchongensis TaxID=2608684 RepID=UPI00124C52F3|nr:TetR/AcrR family transcriptional regulator [Paenibacillus tengchongensis]